jgi:beta-glucuronidase
MGTMLADPRSRSHCSLEGDWRFIVDPYDRGETHRFFECRGRDAAAELVEYDFDSSDSLVVPGDWNTQRPELFLYEGVLWYQRHFGAGVATGRRYFLCFGAVCQRAKVWLNGELVGEHSGGFTPFALEVTERVRDGENSLVVKVDSLHGETDVPTRLTDWKHYGGITRDVLLVELPETFVDQVFVQLAAGDPGRIAGWVRLDGPRARQSVHVVIPELGVDHAVETDDAGFARFEIAAAPEPWSPEAPRLYDVEIRAETDSLLERIGFRVIEVRGRDILLNGSPIFLCGVSLHEESILHTGRAYGETDARALLGLARELGCNFVRLAHYPHDESMARVADELGLLVWEEIPLYWGIAWESEQTFEAARAQLTELVERDRNRASVIFWSISNETPPGQARDRFLGRLVDHARALDPTRLVTSALFGNLGGVLNGLRDFVEARMRGETPEPPTFVLDDGLGDHLDVVGWNEYIGWYYSAVLARANGWTEREVREIVLEGMPSFRVDVPSGKPLVVSEFGAGAKQGRRGGPLDLWTEDYQARVYRQQLAMLGNAPALRGLSPWILVDFRTPIRWLPGVQDGWNRKGLVSEKGERKLAFEVLREEYEQRRSPGLG